MDAVPVCDLTAVKLLLMGISLQFVCQLQL
jgi:hypothetical protein